MISTSSSTRYPWRRANRTRSRALATTAPSSGAPVTVDAAPAPELEEALVAELAEGAQNGVRVHAEHGGQVAGGREPFAGQGFALRDGPPELRGHLLVQGRGVGAVDVNSRMVLVSIAPLSRCRLQRPHLRVVPPVTQDPDALIEEARRHARRRRRRNGAAAIALGAGALAALGVWGGGRITADRVAANGPSVAAAGKIAVRRSLGATVAFTAWSKRTGAQQVFVIRPDGSVTQVTRGRLNTGLEAWSPDGRQLAVDRDTPSGRATCARPSTSSPPTAHRRPCG